MTIYVYAILFVGAVCIGAAVAYLCPQLSPKRLQNFITFIASYIFASTVVHLLPTIFMQTGAHSDHSGGEVGGAGLWLLVGFLAQHFLGQLSMGVEHGHGHGSSGITTYKPKKVLIALIFHSYLEGFIGVNIMDNYSGHGHTVHSSLVGIFLHKMPAAFVLTVMLRNYYPSGRAWCWRVGWFALATPAALLTVEVLRHFYANIHHIDGVIMPVLGGMFLHLSTTMFFEVAPKHKYGWRKNSTVLVGILGGVFLEYFVH